MKSFLDLVKLARKADKAEGEASVKLALLSDGATQQLAQALKGEFFENGIKLSVYEAPIDSIENEIFDTSSEIYDADYIFIYRTTQHLRDMYYGSQAAAADVSRVWKESLAMLEKNYKGQILIANYTMPTERPHGNYTLKDKLSLRNIVEHLNQDLKEYARTHKRVFIEDVALLAASAGLKFWYDERLWTHGKTPCALDQLPSISSGVYSIYRALKGQIIKCVVLDLDGTLWGGVIGDDGLHGIRLGHHEDGEAFTRFQYYLKSLKEAGIILAVCSKNNKETALLPFREHADMVLKEEDIAVFIANWDNKADNIKFIQNVLNIGMDSMMFIDDNPFERNLVRTYIKEILVPEMPEDPSDYVSFLNQLRPIELLTVTEEDKGRAELYQQEVARKELESTIDNKVDFLRSLDMRITMARFDEFHLSRIAQLIQRSNQFNLTTYRYTEADCGGFMSDSTRVPLYVQLRDKFGDYGLISTIILRQDKETLHIDLWLMSCRVLKRGVEDYAMNRVVEEAKLRRCTKIIGTFIPSKKNSMVEKFYEGFDFKCVGTADGTTTWELDPNQYQVRDVYMTTQAKE